MAQSLRSKQVRLATITKPTFESLATPCTSMHPWRHRTLAQCWINKGVIHSKRRRSKGAAHIQPRAPWCARQCLDTGNYRSYFSRRLCTISSLIQSISVLLLNERCIASKKKPAIARSQAAGPNVVKTPSI